MRRKDREVTDPAKIRDILERAQILHLGMIDGEVPYVVPLHYGFEYDGTAVTLFVHSAKEGRKLDVLSKNDNVFVEIDCDAALLPADVPCAWGSTFASVMGEGKATLLEDPAEKAAALTVLMKTQTGKDFTISEQMAAAVAVIRIDLPEVTCKINEG